MKTKIFQPSADGCDATTSSNHSSCSSSMVTSWLVYLAERKTVEPRPTSRVFSAICRLNCMVGLPVRGVEGVWRRREGVWGRGGEAAQRGEEHGTWRGVAGGRSEQRTERCERPWCLAHF